MRVAPAITTLAFRLTRFVQDLDFQTGGFSADYVHIGGCSACVSITLG